MSILGPLLVLAGLVVVFSFLVPGMRPRDRRFRSGRRPVRTLADAARMGSPDDAAGWVAPLVGLLALASLPADPGAAGGAALGALCGLLGFSTGTARARDLGLSVLGAVAAVQGAASVLAGSECGGRPAGRVAVFVLTLLVFAVGAVIGLLRTRRDAVIGLQAFVVVELASFLTAPAGIDLAGGERWVAHAVALAVGVCCGIAPAAALGLFGIGLAVVTVHLATLTTDGCDAAGSYDPAVVVVSGLATFAITAFLVRGRR